jgi:hypothetical protein
VSGLPVISEKVLDDHAEKIVYMYVRARCVHPERLQCHTEESVVIFIATTDKKM